MVNFANAVEYYVRELEGSRADNAWHSLLELGPGALPYISEAFGSARSRAVKILLAQVVCHSRTVEALPFLRELLADADAEIWKTALDGLVMLGSESFGREAALRVLHERREAAFDDRREWVDEAIEQIRSAEGPA